MTSQAADNQSNGSHQDGSTGRDSVISDPGYISSAGSDRSSLLGFSLAAEDDNSASTSENLQCNELEYNGYYNGVLSPSVTSISEVLSQSYVPGTSYLVENTRLLDTPLSFNYEDNSDLETMNSNFQNSSYDTYREADDRQYNQRQRTISNNQLQSASLTSHYRWNKNILNNSAGSKRQSSELQEHGFFNSSFCDVNNRFKSSSNCSFDQSPSRLSTISYQSMPQQISPAVSTTKSLSVEDFSLSVEDFCFDDDQPPSNSLSVPLNPECYLSPPSDRSSMDFQSPQRNYRHHLQSPINVKSESYDNVTSKPDGMTSSNYFRSSSYDVSQRSDEKTSLSIMATTVGDGKSRFVATTTTEDEAWRSYLENPLTAATTAMMSIQGDEDSAAALGLLYDYYKVPREKRLLNYPSSNAIETKRAPVPHQQQQQQRLVGGVHQLQTGANPQDNNTSNVLLCPVLSLDGNSTLGTVEQKVIANPEIVTSTLKTSLANDVITLRPVKTEPGAPTQVFASVADVINLSRPIVDENKRKTRLPSDSIAHSEIKDLSSDTFPDMNITSKLVTSLPLMPRNSAQIPSASNQNLNEFQTNNTNNNNSYSASIISTSVPAQHGLRMSRQDSYNAFSNSNNQFINLEHSGDMFEYMMEAPKSLKQKPGEPTMSYINKGQFYCITLRAIASSWKYKSTKARSTICIVFGDNKLEEEQVRHWKYWHARQHTTKQRIIDIADYKESSMVYDIDEISHNAIAFSWDVCEPAKIFINCNCLSTDFSAQKGIKGLPLLLQIDSSIDGYDSSPVHRGQCQIKVFCDKGAERKIRDEERKAVKRKQKSFQKTSSSTVSDAIQITTSDIKQIVTSSSSVMTSSQAGHSSAKRSDILFFKSIADLDSRPVLFIPEVPGHSFVPQNNIRTPTMSPTLTLSPHGSVSQHSLVNEPDSSYFSNPLELFERGTKRNHSMISSEDGENPSSYKMKRLNDHDAKRVLLYVREDNDEVYDGLMLKTPDIQGLKHAIEEKYKCDVNKITKILKRSKSGILVHMDDNIIRHYSNEDTFIIDIQREELLNSYTYKVTLTEV